MPVFIASLNASSIATEKKHFDKKITENIIVRTLLHTQDPQVIEGKMWMLWIFHNR